MSMTLLDWRRRVRDLYGALRAETDPAHGHALWRNGRDELFRTHPDSPLPEADRATFTGLRYAPYDPAFRFEVEIETEVERHEWPVPTATDGVVPFTRVGVAHLPGLGELDVWWLESYGGGLFVPVKDALAGKATYGGGRYVLDTVKGADLGSVGGRLVIDLNFAYNPSCAYSPEWVCPLAQAGNTLADPVQAGELA